MDHRPTRNAPLAVVVDDNPTILLHAVETLSEAGVSVLAADGSQQALEWLDRHGEDVVLLFTNVEIPGPYNGFALARATDMIWPSIAVLISSGRFKPERPSDMPSGAVFLPKPYTSADVLRETEALLARRMVPLGGMLDAQRLQRVSGVSAALSAG